MSEATTFEEVQDECIECLERINENFERAVAATELLIEGAKRFNVDVSRAANALVPWVALRGGEGADGLLAALKAQVRLLHL